MACRSAGGDPRRKQRRYKLSCFCYQAFSQMHYFSRLCSPGPRMYHRTCLISLYHEACLMTPSHFNQNMCHYGGRHLISLVRTSTIPFASLSSILASQCPHPHHPSLHILDTFLNILVIPPSRRDYNALQHYPTFCHAHQSLSVLCPIPSVFSSPTSPRSSRPAQQPHNSGVSVTH